MGRGGQDGERQEGHLVAACKLKSRLATGVASAPRTDAARRKLPRALSTALFLTRSQFNLLRLPLPINVLRSVGTYSHVFYFFILFTLTFWNTTIELDGELLLWTTNQTTIYFSFTDAAGLYIKFVYLNVNFLNYSLLVHALNATLSSFFSIVVHSTFESIYHRKQFKHVLKTINYSFYFL